MFTTDRVVYTTDRVVRTTDRVMHTTDRAVSTTDTVVSTTDQEKLMVKTDRVVRPPDRENVNNWKSSAYNRQSKYLQTVIQYSYELSSFRCCSINCYGKHRGTSPSYLYVNYTSLVTLHWRHIPHCTQRRNRRFHKHLNRQKMDIIIQFTKEVDKNGKIPFLDCLVTCDNRLGMTIYRKLTHTNRLLDQSSYNLTSHKATTPCIWTLMRRAQLVCDSPDSLQDKTDCLTNIFTKNNYNKDFIRRNTPSNTDSNTQTQVNSVAQLRQQLYRTEAPLKLLQVY